MDLNEGFCVAKDFKPQQWTITQAVKVEEIMKVFDDK
jgi:hypothetical protein